MGEGQANSTPTMHRAALQRIVLIPTQLLKIHWMLLQMESLSVII